MLRLDERLLRLGLGSSRVHEDEVKWSPAFPLRSPRTIFWPHLIWRHLPTAKRP